MNVRFPVSRRGDSRRLHDPELARSILIVSYLPEVGIRTSCVLLGSETERIEPGRFEAKLKEHGLPD